jgi:hypothetical protein
VAVFFSMPISPATQEFYDWLDRVQREDSPWFYEPEKPSDKESIETVLKRLGEARMTRAATPDGANPKGRFVEIPSSPTDRNEELRRQMQASADAILAPLDRVATDMETKWGIGRLETLVPEDWAWKFQSAADKLTLAIYARDMNAVRERAEVMRRGWVKLDELATEAGHQPWGDPDVWEVRTPKGRVYAIARREVDESNRKPSEPGVRFLTLTEVARVLDAWDSDGWITDLRTEFGGRIMEVSPPRAIAHDDRPDVGY